MALIETHCFYDISELPTSNEISKGFLEVSLKSTSPESASYLQTSSLMLN